MTPATKKMIAGALLTLTPLVGLMRAKQSTWGKFQATPKARQLGESRAPILLVEYSDFQCPMCAHVQPSLHQFLELHKGKVRLAYKYFPLSRIHKNAMAAARAAECAAAQDKFWPLQDRLFQAQLQWAPLTDPTTHYVAMARDVHLDVAQFTSCLSDPTHDAAIEQDRREGEDRQISATPTLFVNDERLVGAVIETDGNRIIEREIRRHR